jgi:hypothetical protein
VKGTEYKPTILVSSSVRIKTKPQTMAGSLSLSALREQLASLEKDREMWTQRRALESERCTWIERRQEQQARFDALADAAPQETAALPATENG